MFADDYESAGKRFGPGDHFSETFDGTTALPRGAGTTILSDFIIMD
jgi:hypothetical protein